MVNLFCRSCMVQVIGNNDNMIESFHIFQTKDLAQMFTQCTNLQVHPDDGYPSSVCENCFLSILRFYDFQVMCVESKEKFAKMLKIKPKTEISIHKGDRNVTVSNHVELKGDNLQALTIEDPLSELTKNSLMYTHSETSNSNWNCSTIRSNHCVKQCQTSEDKLTKLHTSNKPEESFIETKDKNATERPESADIVKSDCCEENLTNSSDDEESITDSDSAESNAKSSHLPFQCNICSKQFEFKHRLKSHKRIHQKRPAYPCTRANCDRTYKRRSLLKQHLNDHDGIPRTIFKCDFANCEHTYATQSGLRAHKRNIHSDIPKRTEIHMCETCGAVLKTSRNLRVHRFIHIDKSEWPFVCDVEGCSKRFRILDLLKVHKKRHAGIKNYACPHCEKRFVTNSNLNNHINHHTWEKTWSCEFCPKICSSPASLRAHIRNKHGHKLGVEPDDKATGTPTSNRCFPCSYCDRVFPRLINKQNHELIHTGEKPHVCDECGKKFRTPTALTAHVRTHFKDTGNYVCRICSRAYFTSHHLKHHEMTHTGEKPYKCDECDLTFRYTNNLYRHRKFLHRDNQINELQESKKES